MKDTESNICQIAVIKDGRLVLSETYHGYSKNACCHIASATKSIAVDWHSNILLISIGLRALFSNFTIRCQDYIMTKSKDRNNNGSFIQKKKEEEKDLTFPDFYDEDGEKVNAGRLVDFIQKVMAWQKPEENV